MKLTLEAGIEQLVDRLSKGRLIILAGSGISKDTPSELPDWDGLLKSFINECEKWATEVPVTDDFLRVIASAKATHEKYPARVASVLKQKLLEVEKSSRIPLHRRINRWFYETFANATFNANHNNIVNTAYPFLLTSNYDDLLEKAAATSGFRNLSGRSYTFSDANLVAGALHDRIPCIIHIHGTYDAISLNDIVFTAEDYIQIKRRRPGFSAALQALFLTNSTLFVGYGGSDPHLEDLLEEMADYLTYSLDPSLPRCYLLLREDKADDVLVRYKDKLRTDIITVPDYSQTTVFLQSLRDAVPRKQEIDASPTLPSTGGG